jgi:hypothetical protein
VKAETKIGRLRWWGLLTVLGILIAGCGGGDGFTQSQKTAFFTQSYDPPYLDVLWMIDNRSPMYNDRGPLVQQATEFFQRLDASTDQYRMAFVSQDMQFAKGALQPTSNPQILTIGLGTLDQRVAAFSSLISQQINLNTSAQNQAFASVLAALQNNFVPRSGVPLVLVFISYSDDHSTVPVQGQDDVTYYSQQYLALKGGQSNLLRVYSVNYYPKPAQRCAVQYNAEIDEPGFQNTFFNMAQALGGSTADLCSDFSSQVDLSGLQLTSLPSSFTLEQTPTSPSSVTVTVSQNGQPVSGLTWNFDSADNAVVFNQPPPQGSTIQVSFQ